MILGQETLSVSRDPGGSFVDGRYVRGTPSVISIEAGVQSLGGKELQVLPEGLRERDSRFLLTETELQTVSKNTNPPVDADVVTIDGKEYRVHQVMPVRSVIPHWEVIVIEEDSD